MAHFRAAIAKKGSMRAKRILRRVLIVIIGVYIGYLVVNLIMVRL